MSRKRNVALGCGIVAGVVVLALAGLLVWGAAKAVDAVDETWMEHDAYASIEVGTAERDVRARLPGDGRGSWLTSDMYEQGPEQPDGAVCVHFMSTKDAVGDKETVYRFCFDEGKLVEKREFLATI